MHGKKTSGTSEGATYIELECINSVYNHEN